MATSDGSNISILSQILTRVTVTNTFLFILAYLAIKVVKQIVYYRFFSPIKDFPGPFWGSVTRLWLAWHNVNSTEVKTMQELHEKYGMCNDQASTASVT